MGFTANGFDGMELIDILNTILTGNLTNNNMQISGDTMEIRMGFNGT